MNNDDRTDLEVLMDTYPIEANESPLQYGERVSEIVSRIRTALPCPCDDCFAFYYPKHVKVHADGEVEVNTIGYLCARQMDEFDPLHLHKLRAMGERMRADFGRRLDEHEARRAAGIEDTREWKGLGALLEDA